MLFSYYCRMQLFTVCRLGVCTSVLVSPEPLMASLDTGRCPVGTVWRVNVASRVRAADNLQELK